jgi:hypothetical protein
LRYSIFIIALAGSPRESARVTPAEQPNDDFDTEWADDRYLLESEHDVANGEERAREH